MNNTRSDVVDGWIAYFSYLADVRNGDIKSKMAPDEAANYLSGLVK
jgi:hypothetical protein